jgi:LPS O-antigen subunit length determinant protein (WzzB/FepE family)
MSAIVNNGPFYNAAPDIDEDEIDLGDLIGVLIENRWLIIGITFAAILLGAFHAAAGRGEKIRAWRSRHQFVAWGWRYAD